MFATFLANSRLRSSMACACVAVSAMWCALPAEALVVENMTGTTVAPADDPGWNYVSTSSQNYVYLGNGWALSAGHVGLPTAGLSFNGVSVNVIPGQNFMVKNPTGMGLSAETDLRMVRVNGDPGLAPINIAASQITESTAIGQRQVVFIGNGATRQTNQTHWNVTVQAGANNDIWTEVTPPPNGTYIGYKSNFPNDNTKRWGTNQIADEDSLFGTNDQDLRGNLQLNLFSGPKNIMSMVTQFDQFGLTNEAQVVSGDSGSGVFYKRNGVWELIGIVNAQLSGLGVDGQSTTNAIYGNYSTFADLSFYRNEILAVMNAHQNYSVMGDINLDGIVSGTTTAGGGATGDLAAFVNGWGYNNGTGVGDVTSWKNGDLNRDGKTDYHDFVLLRGAFTPAGGAGSLSLESLFGGAVVPEPASGVTMLLGLTWLAAIRRGRRR